MVADAVSYYVSKIGSYFSLITSVPVVAGVSFGAFVAGLFIVGMLIRNFVYVGK